MGNGVWDRQAEVLKASTVKHRSSARQRGSDNEKKRGNFGKYLKYDEADNRFPR